MLSWMLFAKTIHRVNSRKPRQHDNRSYSMKQSLIMMGLVVGLLSASDVAASTKTLPVLPDLTNAGWQMLEFDGIPPSDFMGMADGTLQVRAKNSSSVLYRQVADRPITAKSLSWSWQVVDGLPATDLRQTDGDDRVLAVHVVFAEQSLMARLKGAMSPFARGRVLTYVWGGDAKGSFPHPHLPNEKGWMTIKRPAATAHNAWFMETVDLSADYKRAFAEENLPPIAYVGISSDADDLGASCFGMIRDIQLN